jgi:hypothetical protein
VITSAGHCSRQTLRIFLCTPGMATGDGAAVLRFSIVVIWLLYWQVIRLLYCALSAVFVVCLVVGWVRTEVLEQRQRRRHEVVEHSQRRSHQPTASPPELLREKGQGMRHPPPALQAHLPTARHIPNQHTYLIYHYQHTDISGGVHVSSYWYMTAPW